MPLKRTTMQDIADACGLSRNTVSKVFNSRGSVPQATRDLVLQTAKSLGYGEAAGLPESSGSIALLTRYLPTPSHFGSLFLSTFTDRISRAGYSLKIYEVSREELKERRLPTHFIPEQISGIVGIDLFDPAYIQMICGLGIPLVLTDSPANGVTSLMPCDVVTMENIAATVALVGRLAATGARRLGFVGDRDHCGSFRERWYGFMQGIYLNGLKADAALSVCDPDDSPYGDPDWLLSRISRMPSLPDAFVCANDYIAASLILALKKKGLSIPKDIMVTGFDNAPQSSFTDPPLTTVHIHSTEIGNAASVVLLNRIRTGPGPFGWTRIKTTPVWRSSTREP